MLSQKEIRDMPLSRISFPKEVGKWQKQWFRDIIERNGCSGDLYAMLSEAYVLGMHHCIVGTNNQSEGGQT